jgi:hypothetical protein
MFKYFFAIVVMIFLVLPLSGCFYTGDYESYTTALSAHSEAESRRIDSQSKAIVEAVSQARAQSATEATLLSVIGMLQIERLHFQPLPLTAPTTGMDVLNTAVGFIPFVTMGATTYKIAERGLQAAGNISLNSENMEVRESFNSTETHATGDSNTAVQSSSVPLSEE